MSFDEARDKWRSDVLASALPDVIFDGWSDVVFRNAVKRSGVTADNAKLAYPNGLKDLVIYFHRSGDRQLEVEAIELLENQPSITKRVEFCVMHRLEIAGREKEVVRRAASYFALPLNVAMGPQLIWETCDLIWRLVGVEDKGFSHYSRRASLAGIYSTTFLYWLQDESGDMSATHEFLKRRLGDLGNFHKMKSKMTKLFERHS